ncbi:tetratricopeptide repeat protein [Glycomyces sp. NPDC047010]|uniref:tetratricopeptide repeat protein n=1 Tax=Glycomyces sp. NPDC047010 TaxID=3155023 RepID=UPI0033EEEB6C
MAENTTPGPGFTNYVPKVHNLIQGEELNLHMHQPVQAHSFADGPLLVGRIPRPAPGRIDRNPAVAAEGRTVLTGLTGAGKTQAAAEYARKRWNAGELDLLVWVDASAPESIEAAFTEAAAAVRGGGDADQFLTWLDRPNAPRWLIVLDGVSDPDHLADLWQPETPRGQTILTTQIRSTALDGHRLHIGPFTPEESAAYLDRRLGANPRALDGAAELAAAFGHLPRALALAAAHLADRPGTTCRGYLDAVPETAAPVTAAIHPVIAAAARGDQPRLASSVLELACRLDPDGIPLAVFTCERALRTYADVSSGRSDTPPILADVEDALADLHRLSLVDVDGDAVRVHPLVQRAAGEILEQRGRDATIRIAGYIMHDIWPGDDDPSAALFIANTERILANTQGSLFADERASKVLFDAVRHIGEIRPIGDAVAYAERFAAACETHLGADHADTLDALAWVGYWHGESDHPETAIPIGEQVLEARLRVLGADHDWTLLARSNLAHWRQRTGDAARAAVDFASLATDSDRVFGPDDERTLKARSDHATAVWASGDDERALAGYEAVRADLQRVLGPDHLDTLKTRSSIAKLLADTGDPLAAAEETEALVDSYVRVLGADHRSTLIARSNAVYYRVAHDGDADAAAAAYAELVDDMVRVFGPDDRETGFARDLLDRYRSEAGDG